MTKKSKKKTKETELQKAFNWINSLSGERVNFIREYSAWQSKKDLKNAVDSFDRALSASVISVLDVEWEIVEMIQEELIKFVDDDIKKMNENKSLYGGLEMAIKKINETEKELVININGLIDKGFKQKEMVEKLVMDFPTLSKAMITNAVKKVRAERVKNTKDAAAYILSENKEDKEMKKMSEKDVKKLAKQIVKNIVEDEENVAKEVDGFEVLEEVVIKEVKLKGRNGVYKAKTGLGVALESEGYKLAFSNIEELESFCNEFKKVFERI